MAEQRPVDDVVDLASMESFPASDPPAYSSRSIGGPSTQDAPPARSPSPRLGRRHDATRTVAVAQSAYYLATAAAPFLGRRAIQRLTGRKRDWWLVQSIGATVGAIGAALAAGSMRRSVSRETRTLGVGAAAGIAAVESVYAVRGRISPVYLLDAVAELAFVAAWIGSARGEPESASD